MRILLFARLRSIINNSTTTLRGKGSDVVKLVAFFL
jgi:hypothetical protein